MKDGFARPGKIHLGNVGLQHPFGPLSQNPQDHDELGTSVSLFESHVRRAVLCVVAFEDDAATCGPYVRTILQDGDGAWQLEKSGSMALRQQVSLDTCPHIV